MAIKTYVLPSTDERIVSLGFDVQLDSETDQLDAVYRALASVQGARVGYLGSKRIRADLPVKPQNQKSVV